MHFASHPAKATQAQRVIIILPHAGAPGYAQHTNYCLRWCSCSQTNEIKQVPEASWRPPGLFPYLINEPFVPVLLWWFREFLDSGEKLGAMKVRYAVGSKYKSSGKQAMMAIYKIPDEKTSIANQNAGLILYSIRSIVIIYKITKEKKNETSSDKY